MHSPLEIAKSYIEIGIHKSNLPIFKMILLGFFAGMFIGFAGIGSTVAASSISVASVAKLVGAMVFPAGMAMVLVAGSELFTGNNLIILSVLAGKNSVWKMLKNWLFVYIGNFIGTTFVAALVVYGHTPNLFQGDLAGAIVNAANSAMLGCFVPCHKCIDNAIHTFSGVQLRLECNRIMKLQGHKEQNGAAKITKSYNLPCDYILHTVGPIVYGHLTDEHRKLLASCYRSCLELAESNGVKSIAFCCISTGEFHFPNDIAAQIAVETTKDYLKHSELERVIFNVFKDTDKKIYEKLLR